MKALYTVFGLTMSAVAVVMSAQTANAQDCIKVCHDEIRCEIKAEPCGSNPDGTLIMCPVEVCRIVEVCEWPPSCTTRPIDEIDGILDTFPPFDPVPFDPVPFDRFSF
jgi:hypothetical protein